MLVALSTFVEIVLMYAVDPTTVLPRMTASLNVMGLKPLKLLTCALPNVAVALLM
jgi:hypothetical protein